MKKLIVGNLIFSCVLAVALAVFVEVSHEQKAALQQEIQKLSNSQKIVQAQRFELVDRNGQRIAILGDFSEPESSSLVGWSSHPGRAEPGLVMLLNNGEPGASLCAGPGEVASLALRTISGENANLNVTSGGCMLLLSHQSGGKTKNSISMTTGDDGAFAEVSDTGQWVFLSPEMVRCQSQKGGHLECKGDGISFFQDSAVKPFWTVPPQISSTPMTPH